MITALLLLLAASEPGSTTLREDSKTGALELIAEYPAGHVFKVHQHDLNERIVMLEGQLHLETGGERRELTSGGYAFIPAKQQHQLACTSAARCRFYVSWLPQ